MFVEKCDFPPPKKPAWAGDMFVGISDFSPHEKSASADDMFLANKFQKLSFNDNKLS
jgi:hypothetical protein